MDNEWSDDSVCEKYGISKHELVIALAKMVELYGDLIATMPERKRDELMDEYMQSKKLTRLFDKEPSPQEKYNTILEKAAEYATRVKREANG